MRRWTNDATRLRSRFAVGGGQACHACCAMSITSGLPVIRAQASSLAKARWFVDHVIRKLAFDLNQFAFNAAVQLMTTVSGCEASSATGMFTKNR
jgi:hypothetical protein